MNSRSVDVSSLSVPQLWEAAIEHPVGIALSTDDRSLLRQQMLRYKHEARRPELDAFDVTLGEKVDELWVVRKRR